MARTISSALIDATLMISAEKGSSVPSGTAFIVVRPDNYNYSNPENHNWGDCLEEGWRIWFVTCAHVIDGIEAIGEKAELRMNERGKEGGIARIAIPTRLWTRHPKWNPLLQGPHERPYQISDADHDVAVTIAPTSYDGWSNLFQGAWMAHWQLTRSLIEQYQLYEGSSASVIGFPMGGWYKGRKDWPVVRSVTIAQVRPYLRENTSTFLIDGNNFPGNSGGPVIADVRTASVIGGVKYPRHRLIGMVCAMPTINRGENAGLGVVVSIEKINEAIDEAVRVRTIGK